MYIFKKERCGLFVASFYKRGKTWSYSIDVGLDKDGKRKKKGVGGFRTKKEAEEAAAQVVIELKDGTYVEEKDVSFKEFKKEWLRMYSPRVKKGTVRIRENEISHLLKYFNLIPMKEVTRKQYQEALIDMQDKGYSESTISGVHCTGRMIFKKAVELGIIKNDPTEYAVPPRKRETVADIEASEELPKFLEKEELATFLRFAHDAGLNGDYAIFMTLAYTGIRVGELCSLKETDLDFKEHQIKITKTYYNPTNNIRKYELVPPKTKSSRRIIKCTDKVFTPLELHLARQTITKNKSSSWHNEGFVFCADKYNGYPIYPKLVGIRMARLLRLSGLNQELTPHSLRHTHTSLLAEAGVGLEAIMERLGHSDDDTTRKIYLHVTEPIKKEAAHKFDQLMNSL
jgi:integrase